MGNISLDVSENIMLSKLKKNDVKDFMRELDLFYLTYRDYLGLPADVSFEVEIEYLGADPLMVDYFVNEIMRDWNKSIQWSSIREPALIGGGEVTSPIMYDETKYWLELKNICEFLKNKRANSLVQAGGHVHVGARVLGDDLNTWRKFMKLYTIYENVLYRFGYGDKINARSKINSVAKPVADTLLAKMWRFNCAKEVENIKDIYPNDTRYYGLNLRHVNFGDISKLEGNTIEFRFPNATCEEVIWQNNINALVKLILAAKSSLLDEDYLDYLLHQKQSLMFNGKSYLEIFKDYENVCFEEALQFCDMIFDNLLDKMYFLKQYFKNFQNTEEKDLVLAKKFIK